MRNLLLFVAFIFVISCSDQELVDLKQISNGAKLYKANCANCHQEDGSGLAKLIPPLYQADYLNDSAHLLPCLIKNGYNGLMRVNGVDYTMQMPANQKLSEAEIADICLYVMQKFPKEPVNVKDSVVLGYLAKCK